MNIPLTTINQRVPSRPGSSGEAIYPRIPKLSWDSFPNPQPNTVQYWGFFSREELQREPGRLLMLDIDFGRECSLRCPTCFRRRNAADDSGDPDLTYDELLDVLQQARELGLKCVKVCGAGEPFENSHLLKLARTLTEWGIGLSIFTKGHVLGDDRSAARVFGHEGIVDAWGLAKRLHELNTSVLVSFQSFRPDVQDRLVGKIAGYTFRRNRAVEILTEVGFNKGSPTRLAFCSNPITRDNYAELLSIYVYCRERNILPIIAALMVSGKQFNKRLLSKIDVTDDAKCELWLAIYRYNLTQKIQTLADLCADGLSAMPGVHPCNQIAAGLYVTCNGTALSCPGDHYHSLGSIRISSLRLLWDACRRRNHYADFNCQCPPKHDITIPSSMYTDVLVNLMNAHVSSAIADTSKTSGAH